MTRILDAMVAMHWAMEPRALDAIVELAQRNAVDPAVLRALMHGEVPADLACPDALAPTVPAEALATRRGEPLAGASRVTVADGVAVVPLLGPIFPRANMLTQASGATSLEAFAADLEVAAASDAVRAILIEADTPGGAATDVADMAEAVRDLAGDMPVVAWASFAASAGYWIAAAATRLVVPSTGVVGSIGVVTTVEAQDAPDGRGYRQHQITSENAGNKRPDPRTESGRAAIKATLDTLEAEFTRAVAGYRGMSVPALIAAGHEGGLRVGAEAVAAGLADGVATFDETFTQLAASQAPRGRSAVAVPRAAANGDSDMTDTEIAAKGAPAPEAKGAPAPEALMPETLAAEAAAEALADDEDTAGALVQPGEMRDGEVDHLAADLLAEARATAARDERARVLRIQHLAGPARQTLALSLIESGASVGDAAVALLEADAEKGAARLGAMAADSAAIDLGGDATPVEVGSGDATPDLDAMSDDDRIDYEWKHQIGDASRFTLAETFAIHRRETLAGRAGVLGASAPFADADG